MLTYTMDALRYREGALAAIWLSLGLTNLSLLFTTAALALERGVVLSLLTAICNGSTLFMTGAVCSTLGHCSLLTASGREVLGQSIACLRL